MFFLDLFIVGVEIFQVDFVSCYIAEDVYSVWEFWDRAF
jgi:hypothetical protein